MTTATDPTVTAIPPLPALYPQPRAIVQNLKPYTPPLEGRRGKTRLDFNENTLGFKHLLQEGDDIDRLTCYPEYQAFIDALAKHLGVPPECVMLTNGSDEALDVIPRTFIEYGVDRALITKPSFFMIGHYMELAGANITTLELTDDLEYPLEAITAELKNAEQGVNTRTDPSTSVGMTNVSYKVVCFATPDNPTSAEIPKAQALAWSDNFPETLFVMDEAYHAYRDPETSCLKEACTRANLLVTQTFSKSWGLAGLRLGYIVGHPEILSFIKRVRSPYSVNAEAVRVAQKLLGDVTMVNAQVANTLSRKTDFMQAIEAEGYDTKTGDTNFFLVKMGLQADNFAQFAYDRGVLVRAQSKQVKLKGYIRISVGSTGENLQLLDTLKLFKRQSALIFDLDDTLVDTSESFDRVVAYLVNLNSEIGLGMKELQLLRAEGGYNDDWDAVKELLRRRNVDMDYNTIKRKGQKLYYEIAPTKETPLLDFEHLAALAKQYRLFIFTGRMREEFDAVWAERLNPYFERVYCSDEIEGLAKKPAPDYLTHIKQTHDLDSAWYVGNSVDDMRAATAAGFHALGVLTNADESALREAGATDLLEHSNQLKEAFACR
jgi:histidinol-phosphate aminotransferase